MSPLYVYNDLTTTSCLVLQMVVIYPEAASRIPSLILDTPEERETHRALNVRRRAE